MVRTAAVALALVATVARADEREISVPLPDRPQTAAAGEPILATIRYSFTPSDMAKISEVVDLTTKVPNIRSGSYDLVYVKAGAQSEWHKSQMGGKFSACRDEAGLAPHRQRSPGYACLLDKEGDGVFDQVLAIGMAWPSKLPHPIRYTVAPGERIDADSRFETRLIYLGSANGALLLSYREFNNDMARAAFTEDLSIPLGEKYPQRVAVKGRRFEIESLSGEGLTYRLLP